MHSYFTTGTFGSNLSELTNEISLMDLYKTQVNILHFTTNSPPICFHEVDLVRALSTRNFSSIQPFKQLRPWLYECFSQS